MKKMKCEICESVAIKKVADDVFECQECGVQYTKAEAIKLLTEVNEQSAKTSVPENNTQAAEASHQLLAPGDTQAAEPTEGNSGLDCVAAGKIEALLRSGNKLEAIGVYRAATGADMLEARKAVNEIAQNLE